MDQFYTDMMTLVILPAILALAGYAVRALVALLRGPAPVLFRSRAHVRRPFVRRPLVISSRGLNVSGAGCRSR